MDLQAAIVSTSLIGPTIWKYIWSHHFIGVGELLLGP